MSSDQPKVSIVQNKRELIPQVIKKKWLNKRQNKLNKLHQNKLNFQSTKQKLFNKCNKNGNIINSDHKQLQLKKMQQYQSNINYRKMHQSNNLFRKPDSSEKITGQNQTQRFIGVRNQKSEDRDEEFLIDQLSYIERNRQSLNLRENLQFMSINQSQQLWQRFIRSSKIQPQQDNIDTNKIQPLFQQQIHKKSTQQNMKIMQRLLQQHQLKQYENNIKIKQLKEQFLKRYYQQSHVLYQKYMSTKSQIWKHLRLYEEYLKKLRDQENQRKVMIQSNKQKTAKDQKLNKDGKVERNFNLSHQVQLNMNDKDIRQVMQKKAKLNLQLDLSFQIQHRKRVTKEKQVFNLKKSQLEKEKNNLHNKIEQIKKKIQQKQKEVGIFDKKRQKMQNQRQYFFKMLLKNTFYRLDGVMWTFRKMIQYECQPKIQNFSNDVDFEGKEFLLNEYKKMKSECNIQPKTFKIKRKKKIRSSECQQANRPRVKSMFIVKKQSVNQPISDLNQSTPLKKQKGFFAFGSRNLKVANKCIISIRKKSGSMNIAKNYQQNRYFFDQATTRKSEQENSFKHIIKEKTVKKIYQSTKSYIKNWINKQGWNSFTSRKIQPQIQNKIPEIFIQSQRRLVKQRYFKIGGSNTKYRTIVKNLFGNQQSLSPVRRVKTSR